MLTHVIHRHKQYCRQAKTRSDHAKNNDSDSHSNQPDSDSEYTDKYPSSSKEQIPPNEASTSHLDSEPMTDNNRHDCPKCDDKTTKSKLDTYVKSLTDS